MNKQIKKETYLKLLELLEEGIITREQFFKLLDLETWDLEIIIKIITLNEIVDTNLLLDQLLKKRRDYHQLLYLLTKYSWLNNNVEKRNFIIDKIQALNVEIIIKLIKYDFIFNDKVLLESISGFKIKQMWDQHKMNRAVDLIIKKIEENVKEYQDGSKNKYLYLVFKIKKAENIETFVELLEFKMFIDNPKWFDYIIDSCNELDNFFDSESIYSIIKNIEESNRTDEINNKLKEIEDMKVSNKEKIETFSNFIDNLSLTTKEDLKDERTWNYLQDKLFYENEKFDIYINNKDILISKNLQSEFYKKIFELENTNIYCVLDALTTSLGGIITCDTIDKIKESEAHTSYSAHKYFVNLAIENNCFDYLRINAPHLLVEKFADSFIEYMTTHPDLTIDEIISQKQIILDTKPEFKDGTYIIDVPTNNENKPTSVIGRAKKICMKIFNKSEENGI